MVAQMFRSRFVLGFLLFLALAAVGALRSNRFSEAKSAPTLLPPVTATNTVTDVMGTVDGNADPGDTLEYSVTVTNGGTAANGVVLNSTLQNITTLVAGSLAASPAPADDTLPVTVVGNVSINSANLTVPFSATTNDFLGINTTTTIATFDATTANGGQISMTTSGPDIGKFTYDPPAGFEGTDTFTYTLSDNPNAPTAAATRTATVSIPVSGMIWFINNNASSCLSAGCGRLSNPFSTLAAFQALNNGTGNNPNNNDNIFVYESGTAYLAGIILRSGQRLIGQDATASLSAITGLTPPVGSAAFPAMNSGNGTVARIENTSAGAIGVQLNSGNTIRGFTAGNAGGAAVGGTNFGTLTVADVIINTTGPGLSLTTGTAAGIGFISVTSTGGTNNVSLNSVAGTLALGTGALSGASGANFFNNLGSATVTYGGTIGRTNGGRVVDIATSTGTFTFSGMITQTGQSGSNNSISLTGNTAGMISFTGGMSLAGSSTGAMIAGTTNTSIVTISSGTISAAGGPAVSIVGTSAATRTPVNIQLTSVSANGGTKGIALTNTSSSGIPGGFTVTGTDGPDAGTLPDAGTGGTIQSTTARGAEFTTVNGPVSLGGMNFTAATATDGTTASDCGNAFQTAANKNCNAPIYFDTVNNVIIRTTDVNGSSQTGIVGYDVTGLTMDSVTVRNGGSTIDENGGAAFRNLQGTSSIANFSFRDNTRAQFDISNNAGVTAGNISFLNNEFTGNRAPNLSAQGLLIINYGTMGTVSVGDGTLANDNNFHDSFSNGLQYSGGPGGSSATLNINENTFTNVNSGVVLQVAGVGAASSLDYSILNNTLVAGALMGSGAIITSATQGHTLDGDIQNNIIGTSGVANSGAVCNSCNGITVDHDGFGRHDVRIVGNTVQRVKSIGIYYQTADASGNVVITGNLVREPEGNPSSGIYIQSGTVAADNGCVAATVGGTTNAGFPSTTANAMNSVQGSWDPAGFQSEIFVWRRFATTMSLPGLSGGEVAWIAARNNIPDATGADITVSGTPFGNGAACRMEWEPPPAEAMVPAQPSLLDLSASSRELLIRLTRSPSTTDVDTPKSVSPIEAVAVAPAHAPPRVSPGLLLNAISAIVDGLDKLVTPTVYAQEVKIVSQGKLSPESGETVTSTPAFTIPAGRTVKITYRARVDDGPYAAGVHNITNFATLSGSNFVDVNSTTASIPLDAAPDLKVTSADGGGTTQPGGMVTYTLSYENMTSIRSQGATGVSISQPVPTHATFNAPASTPGWSCADGSPGATTCTFTVGALNAAASGSVTFAVKVLDALPAGAVAVAPSATISDDAANGADLNGVDNTANESTNIIGNWDGSASTDWFTAANWSNDTLPAAGQNVSIPNVANQPVVTGTNVTVNNLVLNGENATVGAGRTIAANGTVTLGANVVDGAGTLALGTAATVTRTTGRVESTMRKSFAAPGPSFTFPLGTPGAYSPIDVTVTTGAGELSARANTGVPAVTPVALNPATTLNRYFSLSGSGITSNIVFHYLPADVLGNEANYRVIRVSGNVAVRWLNNPNFTVQPASDTFTVLSLSTYSDWLAGEPLPPTSATVPVSGRVTTPDGRGIPGARVELIGPNGEMFVARTSPFGYYRIAAVESGRDYVISVTDKRYLFASRLLNVAGELTEIDLIGTEP